MSNDAQPSFVLRPCPMCSNSWGELDRPRWAFAWRTTQKERRRHWIFVGCSHARAIADSSPIGTQQEIHRVEARWNEALPALFAAKTQGWPEASVLKFARRLEERPFAYASQAAAVAAAANEQRTTDPAAREPARENF